eukprot:TRINITY_DN16398_c0_g1_i3.p2 TRINITY_DN16398_c0_g1~~TRINITY_DN16398_c0_g1_i3.p2  ORF type:complete len:118 (+),score=30.15 TRINITY_DN16398_c0_g1_i3:1095-1448(+)
MSLNTPSAAGLRHMLPRQTKRTEKFLGSDEGRVEEEEDMCTAVEGWRGWRYWKGKGEEERVRLKMMGFLLSVERNGKWGRREGLQGREIIEVFERLAESPPAIPFIFFSSFSLFTSV